MKNNLNNQYKIKTIFFSLLTTITLVFSSTAIGSISHFEDRITNYTPPEIITSTNGFIDDCDSVEVTVGDIISPPSYGMMGSYDITTEFTAVGIQVNGGNDIEDNEPWIEHEESPDTIGCPIINFYTSCDEENMYIAFKNKSGGISFGEIFIDKNGNGSWDGPEIDTYFKINNTRWKVTDFADNVITGSSVYGWSSGKFIEIQIPKTNWSSCNNWAFRISKDGLSWNPSWGDNSASATPPTNKFLSFTCDYMTVGDGCPCGVAIKALVDVYKMQPGNFNTVFETDFEDLNEVEQEWNTISEDEMSDTWTLSQTRSHSSSHSFHCTNYSDYYGNSHDILEMKNTIDLSDVDNVSLSFWHWCEGDSYDIDGNLQIADYGDVELYTNIDFTWKWISLSGLGISNLHYDNNWMKSTIFIESMKQYSYEGENISGSDLLTAGAKFRFVWKSDPQFQFEGWYIDDVEIIVGEKPDYELIWQTHYVYWCVPFGSTITRTFPMQWTVDEEGKYMVRVSIEEKPPWCALPDPYNEKIIIIGEMHDVAVTSLKAADAIDNGEDLFIEATIENVGTYDETNVQVKASIKKDGVGSPIWERTTVIPSLNMSELKELNFTWENAKYGHYQIEITAILPSDEVPENNSRIKWMMVATTIFEDDMETDCCWDHFDLTGGDGHWKICTSGYDKYLWCGITETTKYDNEWNDVAQTNNSLNLSSYSKIYLNFTMYSEIEENDSGYVEISGDNGRHWNTLSEYSGDTQWIDESLDISSYNENRVVIRFRFYSNESITDRGWIIDDVSIVGDGSIIFSDDFGSGINKWNIERIRAGDWWQITTMPKDGNMDNKAFWCGDELVDMYPANIDNILVLKDLFPIDLSKSFGAMVIFSTWYNISEGDLGTLEISEDGNLWQVIGSYSGESKGWITDSIDITSWIGGDIVIRFRFTSDNSIENKGWYIDDVKVVAMLDYDPPDTTCNLAGTMGENNWYTSSVQITLTAGDEYSGVKNTYYRINSGSQQTYTSKITVSEGGEYTIEYWSEDKVGNVEAANSKSFKIDVDIPTIGITKPDGGIYSRDRKLWPIFENHIFDWNRSFIFRAITITTIANDGTSGIDKVEFYIDDVLKETSTGPYEWFWDETVFFKKTIKVVAYDEAGHSSSASREVTIFNIAILPR